MLAKAAFLAGPVDGPALIAESGAAGIVVADDGSVHPAGNIDAFLVPVRRTSTTDAPAQVHPHPSIVKAGVMKVWIDQKACVGNGICAEICPEVFVLADGDIAYVRDGDRLLAGR